MPTETFETGSRASQIDLTSPMKCFQTEKLAPIEPGEGKFILSVSRYLDVWNTGEYAWLKKYKPIAEVGYCYLLFEVK